MKYNVADYIETIEINGLRGRMIDAPGATKAAQGRNILFVHGHHSSLERLSGVAELLHNYANVCLPDMPGFGGMDHLYQVGLRPTIDNLADYMAAFIKLHYGKTNKFVIVGFSMGFLVVTRMLQKYPDLHSQIIEVISMAGFVHSDDFTFSKKRIFYYRIATWCIERRIFSWIFREIFLRKWCLNTIYTKTHNAREKFKDLPKSEIKRMVDFEYILWRINHIPTWCHTTREMFNARASEGPRIPLKLKAIMVKDDQYFNSDTTKEHMKHVYEAVDVYPLNFNKHSVSVIASADEARQFIPDTLLKHIESL